MFFFRGFSLHEALAIIEEDDFPHASANIVMLPPEDGADTDEDSGDEDAVSPDNLPSAQLRAPAEIEVPSEDSDTEDDNIPLARLVPKSKTPPISKASKLYNWSNTHIQYESNIVFEPAETIESENNNEQTPVSLFSNFFDESIFDLLTKESNRYAALKNQNNKPITTIEMKAFIGILILSGYVPYPRRKLYWEKDKDVHNQLVSEALSRDRFDYIMRVFHMADNNDLSTNDKFSKIRPLFKLLNENFLKFAPEKEHHSVDEAMVPYFGRHGCKQFIKGKPIRWGYKLWVGCTRVGYINWFEPYQGASTHVSPQYKDMGVGAGVVLTYVDRLRSRWPESKFHIFFDNFFSSMTLLDLLSANHIRGTGTIRSNRIPRNPLKTTELKKSARGTHDYKADVDKKLTIVSWHDNSIVSLASNAVGVNPIRMVKRYSQQEKKSILVPQPYIVKLYNENMGGVDRCDQNMSLYRTAIRGKKWYFCLFSHCIDMAIQNAWQLSRIFGDQMQMDQLAFRRRIACSILQTNSKVKNHSIGRPSKRENIDSRYDGINHYVIPQDRQTRCRKCHLKTTTKCLKCDIGLHVRCFVQYHTK